MIRIDTFPSCSKVAFLQIARTKWARSVRNLLSFELLESDLSPVTSIENLWFSGDYLSNGAIHILPLKHLYCRHQDLFTSKPINCPSLSHITHLELFGGIPLIKWDDTQKGLAALQFLTHLALNDGFDGLPFARSVLDTCKSIQALILLYTNVVSDTEVGTLADDSRFVIMSLDDKSYIEDWQHGVLTGGDYWACADAFITQRISGAIPRECRLCDSPPAVDSPSSFRTQLFSTEGLARDKLAKSSYPTLRCDSRVLPSLLSSVRCKLHRLSFLAFFLLCDIPQVRSINHQWRSVHFLFCSSFGSYGNSFSLLRSCTFIIDSSVTISARMTWGWESASPEESPWQAVRALRQREFSAQSWGNPAHNLDDGTAAVGALAATRNSQSAM
jgi:hypothetical protein